VLYLAAQAVLGACWWALLALAPESRAAFRPAGAPDAWLLGFLPADLALFIGGSGLAAALLARRSGRARRVLDATAGAVSYGALVCLGQSLLTGEAWAAALAMASAAVATIACALLARARLPFRVARPAPVARHAAKTLAQAAAFWSVLLGLFPAAIASLERAAGVPSLDLPLRAPLGAVLFALGSAIGLASAAVMSVRGEGTPLPLDAARRLVVAGPYAHIRNPMAVSGLVQAVAVGLLLGSWGVLAYVAAGAIAWNSGARPHEEADLLARFGEEYARYRDAVPCWRPRLRPYRPSADGGTAGRPGRPGGPAAP
jgi:protein-S-isoprenylcysteine O-methyltransferase Ste14